MSNCVVLCRHINGPRYYGEIEQPTYTEIQSIQISSIDPTVSDHDSVHQSSTIAIQDVNGDNPVDLDLVCNTSATSSIGINCTSFVFCLLLDIFPS